MTSMGTDTSNHVTKMESSSDKGQVNQLFLPASLWKVIIQDYVSSSTCLCQQNVLVCICTSVSEDRSCNRAVLSRRVHGDQALLHTLSNTELRSGLATLPLCISPTKQYFEPSNKTNISN